MKLKNENSKINPDVIAGYRYAERLKQSFMREFNNNKKQIIAENKQRPIKTIHTKIFSFDVCLS